MSVVGKQRKILQNENNFFAIGAIIELFVGNEKQLNYIAAGNGYCSQNTFDIHFGLDTINYIDSVKIIWPDNQDEVFYDINVNNKIYTPFKGPVSLQKLNQHKLVIVFLDVNRFFVLFYFSI